MAKQFFIKKLGIISFVIFLSLVTGYQNSHAKRKNYYRTFEIIRINEKGISLRDNDGNVVIVDKDPGTYKVGYKVRYDSVRKRLRDYRWQDYEVMIVSGDSMTLQHKTGDTISVPGNYSKQYKIGDSVRYDSVDGKVQLADDSTQWQQYTVVAASSSQVTIRSSLGEKIVLQMNNNVFSEHRGVYIPKYKVGDLVRYDIKNNKLKKEVRRTYDWQEYQITNVTKEKIILENENNEKIILENIYGTKFNAGDQVKFDRLNNLLKKTR